MYVSENLMGSYEERGEKGEDVGGLLCKISTETEAVSHKSSTNWNVTITVGHRRCF